MDSSNYYQEYDKGHGRIEKRSCWAAKCVWFKGEGWANLNSIVMVKTEITIKDKKSSCTRYFITKLKPNAELILKAIRAHWLIESMHWSLDVTFNEDSRIVWNRTIGFNEAIARRIAMNMLKEFRETYKTRVKTEKASYKLIQREMFIENDVLEGLLRKAFE